MINRKENSQSIIKAVILAGGKGSRFDNEDKGLITLNNKAFVLHVAERLSGQVEQIYISCNRNQEQYRQTGFEIIEDSPYPSEGPLCAISSALDKIDCDALLVCPCDSPLVPIDLREALEQSMVSQHKKISCVKLHGKVQPLFCLISKGLLPDLQEAIKRGERKTADWINRQEPAWFNDDRDALYLNINSRKELESFITKQKEN